MISLNFTNAPWVIFKSNDLKLDLEDDVRIDLILDNLKLHHHYTNRITTDDSLSSKRHKSFNLKNNSKYLEKIFRILIQWEKKINNSDISEAVLS